MMILGSSVPEMLLQLNMLQIAFHALGVLFTAWFVVDSWRYTSLWALWGAFAIPPLLIEILSI